MLDMRSVVLSGVLLDVMCMLVVLAVWRQNRARFEGLSFWAADYVLQTAGLVLVLLRGAIPDWASIILANACVSSGALMGLCGVERLAKSRTHLLHQAGLLALFLSAHVYLTYVAPSLWLRGVNIALVLLIICARCAWLLLCRADAELRTVTRLLGGVFASYTLLFALRLISSLVWPDRSTDFFANGLSEPVFVLATQMHFVFLTYALTLTVNKRLMQTIQLQEEKYSKSFHNAPYAMALTRMTDGTIIEANDTLAQSIGCVQGELLGKSTIELGLWSDPADRQRVLDAIRTSGRAANIELSFKNHRGERIVGLLSTEVIRFNRETCLLSTICDITERKRSEEEREQLVAERERALLEVRNLSGLLPICASCKKIRDEAGHWHPVESYVRMHSQAEFSHGLCPECEHALYGDAEPAGASGASPFH